MMDIQEIRRKYGHPYVWDHYSYTNDCRVMVKKILHYLKDHSDKRISIETLANALDISGSIISGAIRVLVAYGILSAEKYQSVFISIAKHSSPPPSTKNQVCPPVDTLADKFVKLVSLKKKELYNRK